MLTLFNAVRILPANFTAPLNSGNLFGSRLTLPPFAVVVSVGADELSAAAPVGASKSTARNSLEFRYNLVKSNSPVAFFSWPLPRKLPRLFAKGSSDAESQL